MEINVETLGLEELLERFQNLGVNTDVFMDRAIGKGALRLQAHIKPLVPVDEGTLRNSISVEKTGHLEYSVGTNLKYSVFVEYGTGKLGDPEVPHTEKESWVYYSEKLGRFVTTHGQPAVHYMHNGFTDGKDAAVDAVVREVHKWLT